MKRTPFIRLFAMLMALTLLAGCGSPKGKPKDLPQDVYDMGVAVVEVIEKYLDGSISLQELSDGHSSVSSELTAYCESADLSIDEGIKTTAVLNADATISLALSKLSLSVATESGEKEAKNQLKDGLKKLKKALGM